jgi:hypothetical protein
LMSSEPFFMVCVRAHVCVRERVRVRVRVRPFLTSSEAVLDGVRVCARVCVGE